MERPEKARTHGAPLDVAVPVALTSARQPDEADAGPVPAIATQPLALQLAGPRAPTPTSEPEPPNVPAATAPDAVPVVATAASSDVALADCVVLVPIEAAAYWPLAD